jgi:hypothetical protein
LTGIATVMSRASHGHDNENAVPRFLQVRITARKAVGTARILVTAQVLAEVAGMAD